jgi:hypothetical protein
VKNSLTLVESANASGSRWLAQSESFTILSQIETEENHGLHGFHGWCLNEIQRSERDVTDFIREIRG